MVVGLARVIAWLRGDPESLIVVKSLKGLLEAQGLIVLLPDPEVRVKCDVVVEPVGGVPLEFHVEARASIRDPDPWRAIFKALSAPGDFKVLRVGIDPGARCSIAAYADNILVWLEKVECRGVGPKIKWLIGVIETESYRVNLGGGAGFEEAARSLSREGIPFTIALESWTTSRPVQSKVNVKDPDLLAAMTIALYR